MFIICIGIMAVSGATQAIAGDYVMFAFLVFINSVGTAGVYPLAFIIGNFFAINSFFRFKSLLFVSRCRISGKKKAGNNRDCP